jgi:hypothetical protein
MPRIDLFVHSPRTMTMHLPLHPRPECPEQAVYMPRVPMACVGRIVRVEGGAARIDAKNRKAYLRLDEQAPPPSEIVLAWDLGGPSCDSQYRGLPPFFLEGEPAAVTFLQSCVEWEGP